jgi:hypothetical protein
MRRKTVTKSDEALYHAVARLWEVVHTLSLRVKSYQTADKDDVIENDLLEAQRQLAIYRELLRENRA